MSRVNDLCWPEQLPPWPDFQPLGSSLSLLFFSISYILLVVQEFLFLAWTWCLLLFTLFLPPHLASIHFQFEFLWNRRKLNTRVDTQEEEGDLVREPFSLWTWWYCCEKEEVDKVLSLWLMQLKESADLFTHVVTSCLWHHYSFYDTSRIFSTCSSFCHSVAITSSPSPSPSSCANVYFFLF